MVKREYWTGLIEKCFEKRSIVWLHGVRRVGKTFLCKSIPGINYFDCEAPEQRRIVEDERFLKNLGECIIALDEIHRLTNPTQILKIAADYYPGIRIIATGSSILSAYKRFKDTLTGRKRDVLLTPMVSADMDDFKIKDIEKRMLFGGLPSFIINDAEDAEYAEWLDSYWARDVIDLFHLEKRHSFLKFVELLMVNSGGIFEATRYAGDCEVSRPTIYNYLSALELTSVMRVIRPFSFKKSNEIVSAPKIYGFDTGFVCNSKGWRKLRREDYGILWEHIVLNELQAVLQSRQIHYWRDKYGHEIDFVLYRNPQSPDVIECKWSVDKFSASNITIFRRKHKKGRNYLIAYGVEKPHELTFEGKTVRIIGLPHIAEEFGGY